GYRGVLLAWMGVQREAIIVQTAFNAVLNANPIGLIITAIAALGAALVIAYQRSETFRNIVQTAWQGIQTAAMWAWNNVLKPAIDGLVIGFRAVATAATWLWTNILSPVFSFISAAAKILLTAVVVVVLLPIIAVFKLLAVVATWLWQTILQPAFQGIAAIALWLWNNAIKPYFNSMVATFRAVGAVIGWLWTNVVSPVFGFISSKAVWLWNNAIKPVVGFVVQSFKNLGSNISWLWNNVVSPVFGWIGDKAKWLWNNAVKPAFDMLKRGVKAVGDSFNDAKDFIARAWNKVQDIAKKPVRFIIDKVYNAGIVPVWNKVAGAFGAKKIAKMDISGWASGGVLPGYTPGRDVHRFYSTTGGGLELSGGEAIMRPEWTRAVGPGFVALMNRVAKSRGAKGVREALAPTLGGNPTTQRFADGGIFGWIGKTAAGVGSRAWEGIKKAAEWLKEGLEASARAGVKHVIDPMLSLFPGADTAFGKMIRRIPTRILDAIFGYSKEADKRGAGGGVGGPRVQAALKWARSQNGKAYQWGGNGNPSWDCSGFLSAIESVLRGQKPHRRWSTFAFQGGTAPAGWAQNATSPFRIGITNAGVGHTAGTLGGVNVESRGGDGVVVGKRARGYSSSLFTHRYGFVPAKKFDAGGWLQPGVTAAVNATGRPEAILTARQWQVAQTGLRQAGSGLQPGDQVTLVVQDGPTLKAYVDGRAQGRVDATLRPAITAMRANRKGP
ncbi:hypothetical protein ACFWZO_30755, partial [Streptomyces sp. NPDC059015]